MDELLEVQEHQRFWQDQFATAHKLRDPERIVLAWRFLHQCDLVVAALTGERDE